MTTDERLAPETLRTSPPSSARAVETSAAEDFAPPARAWWRDLHLDAGSIALSGMILWFAFEHFQLWVQHPGVFVGLGGVLLELLQGSLLLFRRRDSAGRQPLKVWAAATIGSWGFLLARPVGGGYFNSDLLFAAQPLFGAEKLWLAMQLAGTAMAIASLSSLGRSFGLLAANRGVRTSGPYRIVRHPAYASYFIVQFAYLLENLSLWNLALLSIVVVAQLVRIHQEEAVLLRDTAYRLYSRQVRYRLVPGLF